MTRIAELISNQSDRVSPEATLRDVATRMLELRISSVIVVDRGGAILGIITERDMLRIMRQRGSPEQSARDSMTSPVHSVPADMDFRQAYREAASLGIRRIVVVDDAGLPLGIVSESDFRKHLGTDFFLQLNSADTLMERTVPCLPASAGLDDALTAMEAVHGSCVVVVDGRRPLGIVTEHDIVRLFMNGESNPILSSVMTQPTISIHTDSPLTEAARQMLAHNIRHLTVLDASGNLAGLISEHRLMSPLLALVHSALSKHKSLAVAHEHMQEETARTERYQQALLDNFPYLVWLKDTESRFLAVNRALAVGHGGHSAEEIVGKTDFDLSPPELAEHYRTDDAAVMASRQNKIVIEQIIVDGRSTWHETYKAPVVSEDGTLLGTVGFARDISERKRADEAMQLRNAALAELIGGESLPRVLELITLSVEAQMPDWRCSIMLADESGQHLHLGAAPSLPAAYSAAINGQEIGQGIGSCCTAAALRQRSMVENIFESPNWAPFHELAREVGFTACCSEPIIGPDGLLLGTFAAYHGSASRPREQDLGLLTQASQLAALVIAHQHRSHELKRSLETFRGIFDSTNQALFIQAEDGTFLDVNLGAETLSGFPSSTLIGKTPAFLVVPGLTDLPTISAHLAAAFAGTPQVFEILGRHSAGRIFPLEIRLQKSRYFGRPVLIASAIEISERKNAELHLEVEYDLAQALAAGMQRDEVLGTLLKAALRFPDLEAGCVHWRQGDGSYSLIAHHGLSAKFVGEITGLEADSPFARFAQSGGTVCNCEPPSPHCADENVIDSAAIQAEGLGCLAALPIMLAGQTVACLSLGSRQSTGVLDSTLRALETLGSHFSQALRQLTVQEEARRQQQNLSGLFDTLKDFIFIFDEDGLILHYNLAVAEGLGYGPESLKGKPVATVHPENMQKMADEIMADIVAGRRISCPLPLLRANGEQVLVESRITAGYWDGCPAMIGVAQDIGERVIAEERQQLAASVFENAHEGIMITDPRGYIVEVNSTFSELTGYGRDEAIGQTPELLKSGHHEPVFYEDMWRKIRDEGFWRGEVWNRKKTGEIFVELLTISSVRNRSDEIVNFVGIFSDITLIKQHQQRLEHLANFDALTQLPNRVLLGDRMQLAMAQTERSGKMLAICYLDLDNFKPINDLYGHSAGDLMLIEFAQRLKTCVRAGDTVSRLGGDEFVLLIANLDDVHECDHAIARVTSALTQPFRVAEHSISISASIGVTLYPHDGADADMLLRHADQAMYAAKQAGRNRHHLFDPENDRRTRVRREEISRIREGLANGEFALYYQPKVNMRKGIVVGAEALIRWQHPDEGLLLPGRFLPSIEGSELEIEIGDWVIQEALRQIEAWHALGLDLSISINISGDHLQHKDFSRRLAELLASHPKVEPGQLELEVLETAALEDIANVADLFGKCQELGVSFALDDFGTGYSSLTYFRRLPAEVLKIDQSFVRNMLDDADDLAIVEGVIGLTQAFRRQVIAEGVETVEHGLVLLLLGCDMAQGFGIARPMLASKLPEWIQQFRPDELWSLATAFQWSREDLPLLIAEANHQRWKKSLYAYMEDTTGTLPIPPTDHRKCRFGQWYHNPESQRYAAVDSFESLGTVHTGLHDLGKQLLNANDRGDMPAVASLKLEFEQQSQTLSECIQQIQAEVLINTRTRKR